MWLVEQDPTPEKPIRVFIDGDGGALDIPGRDGAVTGVKAIKVGGHFPGSMVVLHDRRLLVADTMMPTPSGMGNWGEKGRPPGMNSFAFMWSYPNVRHQPCHLLSPTFVFFLHCLAPLPLPRQTLLTNAVDDSAAPRYSCSDVARPLPI